MADLVCIIIIIVPHRGLEAKKPASRLIVDSVCLLLSTGTSNKSSFAVTNAGRSSYVSILRYVQLVVVYHVRKNGT